MAAPGRRLTLIAAGAAVVLAAALYLNALGGPFVYDDIVEIRDNTRVHDPANIPSLLTSDFWGAGSGRNPLYRPLTAVVTTLVYVLGGASPLPFHLLNLLLHAAASGAAVLLLSRLTGSLPAAAAGGLLFAAHPVHTEAVTWISGQAELVSSLCVILAWLAHLRGRTIAAVCALAFGVLSKEGAAVFPALVVAGDMLSGHGWRDRIRSYTAYTATVGLYMMARLAVLGHLVGGATAGSPLLNPLRDAAAMDRVLTSISVMGRAILQSTAPRRLCLDYGYDQIPVASSPLDAGVPAGLALMAGLIAAAMAVDRLLGHGGRPAMLGAALFFITFLPASNLLFPGISIFAERNLYLPVLGVCAIAGLALACGSRAATARRGVALALVAACGLATVQRNREFGEPIALYDAAVDACPRSARAHSFRGIALREAGRTAEAISAQRAALAIAPRYSEARAELGLALAMTGDAAGAERELAEALRLNPEDREARANLATLYAETGRLAEAVREGRTLLSMFPDDPEVRNNYAATLIDTGDPAAFEEARSIYERLAAERPHSPLGPNGLGALHARQGRWDLAAAAFEEALRRSPGDPNATYNLAQALVRSGRPARAIEVIDRALAAGVRDEGLLRLREAAVASGGDGR